MPMVWKLNSNTACHGLLFRMKLKDFYVKTVFSFLPLIFQKAVLFFYSVRVLYFLCVYGREKLRFLFQKINGKNPKNQLSMENDFQARNTPQRLVINSSQNIRDLLSLRDNPYLPIAVKKIQMATRNFIISENIGKENLLVLANLPKPIFVNLP